MRQQQLQSGRKVSAFENYLRTGRRPQAHGMAEGVEVKFNPWHDSDDGRFTFAGQGRNFPQGSRQANNSVQNRSDQPARTGLATAQDASPDTPEVVVTADRTTTDQIRSMTDREFATYLDMENWLAAEPRRLGQLSARYESRGDPGTVSTGQNDAGGVSYGLYQFATNTGTAAAFVASPEFRPWAADFAGLRPGTAAFGAQWRAVAARDSQDFSAAQYDYIRRTHYDRAVNGVDRNTGYDLNTASMAVREATWSVATQHDGAATILSDAVRRTERTVSRTDPHYEAALIDNIYGRRTEYVQGVRDRAVREHRLSDARGLNNVINNRYPSERADAQRMLQNEQERGRP